MENKDIVDTLNPLIETSRDGDKGFSNCADDSTDPALKAYFTTCAQRCRDSVRELEAMVIRYGGKPATSGHLLAGMHRVWLDVRTALSSKNDLAVLEVCENAEDVAKKAYVEALEKELPMDVRTLVEKQFEGVRHNHDHVRKLRDEKKMVDA